MKKKENYIALIGFGITLLGALSFGVYKMQVN